MHMRIHLLVRYSQWTRTVTELPTVKGFMTKCNGVYIPLVFYCTVFNVNDIFYVI